MSLDQSYKFKKNWVFFLKGGLKWTSLVILTFIQFRKMNVRRLLSYEAKLLYSEGRGRM